MAWLRGLDLNQRSPGYEPQDQLARLCLSTTYVHGRCRCSTVFQGVLFPICSPSCSQNRGAECLCWSRQRGGHRMVEMNRKCAGAIWKHPKGDARNLHVCTIVRGES